MCKKPGLYIALPCLVLVTAAWWSNESTSPTLGKISTGTREIGENDFQISFMGPEGVPEFDAFSPAVAYNSTDDEFLVVWIGSHEQPPRYEVFAQRLEAGAGNLIGAKIRLSDNPPETISNLPSLVYNPQRKEYLFCWQQQDLAFQVESEIYFQIINSKGKKRFPNPLQLSEMGTVDGTLLRATRSSVTYNSIEQEYLVVWQGEVNIGEWEVFAQRIGAENGFPLKPDDLRVTAVGEDDEIVFFATAPDVAFNSIDNYYLVVWHAISTPAADLEVYGRFLDARLSANAPSSGFKISEMGAPGEAVFSGVLPSVAFNPVSEEFLVVWHGDDFVDGKFEIYGQRIHGATGSEVGLDDFQISQTGPAFRAELDAFAASVVYNSDQNEYLVIWESEGTTFGEFEIFGQRIHGSAGSEIGENDFRISDMGPDFDTGFGAFTSAVAYSEGSDEYLVVWAGDDSVDGEFEIYGQRIEGAAAEPTEEFSPSITVTLDGQSSGSLAPISSPQLIRESIAFLDQDDIPGTRILQVDNGAVNWDSLVFGSAPIETEGSLEVVLGGKTITAATAKIIYVVREVSEDSVVLRAVFSEIEASPIVLALVPEQFGNIAQGAIGFSAIDAVLTRPPNGAGFTLVEVFNSAKSVSEDYKGFSAQVTTRDTFDEDFFMMPRFQGRLKVASDFTSRVEKLSSGVHTSEFQINGPPAPTIELDPNPIQVCEGRVGQTWVSWNASGVESVEVRVSASDGNVFALGPAQGTAQTGLWVRDGMTFYLVDGSSADALATVTATFTSEGCPFPPRLYFPQFGNSQGLFSEIVLTSLALGIQTKATISLKDDDGNPLTVNLNGQRVTGELSVILPPGGVLRFKSDGIGPLITGSVTVGAENEVDGVILFGGDTGLAGVGNSPGFEHGFIAPIETDVDGTNTGIAFMGLGEATLLDVTLRDVNGQALLNAELDLSAFGHRALFVDQIPWAKGNNLIDFSSFTGLLDVSTDRKIATTVIQTRAKELATLPVVGKTPLAGPPSLLGFTGQGALDEDLHFAQFGDGLDQIFSQIILFNLSDEMDATGEIRLRDDTGDPLGVNLNGQQVDGSLPINIPVRSLRFFQTDGQSPELISGSVSVVSDVELAGTILFGGDTGVAGVGSSVSLQEGFSAPIETDSDAGINTGIAVVNLEGDVTVLELLLTDPNGAPLAKSEIQIEANGHTAVFVDQIEWNLQIDFSEFKGNLRVLSQGKSIGATVIQTRPGQLATIPVSALN